MSAVESGYSTKDRLILRDLAKQIAELASRPIEAEKKQLWYDHNALQHTRPLVFCDPENSWNEIITPESLTCEGDAARGMEWCLRQEIFWGSQMGDDRVTEGIIGVGFAGGVSDWGMRETVIGAGAGKAYVWESPLKDLSDLSSLHFPQVSVDLKSTEEWADSVNSLLGDILPTVRRKSWWWSLGLTSPLVKLRGLEQVMYDMLDTPDDFHRLMAFLRDGFMAMLDDLEAQGLLTLNNKGDYVGSGGFGWTNELPASDFDGHVRCADIWGFVESQETVGVSPDMYEEFIFPYEVPMMERFGLNCYGCCEPLDRRWNSVKRFHNLRRVSVSPWADVKLMVEYLEDKYILSLKPNPSALAMGSFDEEFIRSSLREALEAAKGCVVEVIMKDTHTICKDPQRVIRWTQIAKEEAERIS